MRMRSFLSLVLTLCMFISLGVGANAELLLSSPEDILIIDHFFVLDDFGLDYLAEARILITRYLEDEMGFNRAAIAGILSNMYSESSLRSDALGDGGTSYGLCQWHAVRFNMLDDFASDEDSVISDITTQLDFFKYEMLEMYPVLTEKLRNVENSLDGAYVAAYLMCHDYERPIHSERKSHIRGQNAQTDYSDNSENEYLYSSDELLLMRDNYMDHMNQSSPYIMDFSTFDDYILPPSDIVAESVIGGAVQDGIDKVSNCTSSEEDIYVSDLEPGERESVSIAVPEFVSPEADVPSSEQVIESVDEEIRDVSSDEASDSLPADGTESILNSDEPIDIDGDDPIPVAEIPGGTSDDTESDFFKEDIPNEDNIPEDHPSESSEESVPVAYNPDQSSVESIDPLPSSVDDTDVFIPGGDDPIPEATDPEDGEQIFNGNIDEVIDYSLDQDNSVANMFFVRFLYPDGSLVGAVQTIAYGESADPPLPKNIDGKYFSHWAGNYSCITHDTDIVAVYSDIENSDESIEVVPKEFIERMAETDVAQAPPEAFSSTDIVSDLPDNEKTSGDGKSNDSTDVIHSDDGGDSASSEAISVPPASV